MNASALGAPLRFSPRPLALSALMLLATLVALHAAWDSYRSARASAEATRGQALQRASAAAAHAEAVVLETRQLLRVLGGISPPGANDPADCSRFLLRQRDRFPAYDNLAFLGPDGALRCSARPLLLPTLTPGDAVHDGRLQLVFYADGVAALLARDPDEGAGATAAVFPAEHLLGASLGTGEGLALIDAAGRLLAARPSRAAWFSGDPAFGRTLAALEPAAPERLSPQPGREYLYVAQDLHGTRPAVRLVFRLPPPDGGEQGRSAWLAALVLGLAACTGLLLRQGRARGEGPQPPLAPPARPPRRGGAVPAGETTLLRQACEALSRLAARQETQLEQLQVLDALARALQACTRREALAEAVARAAQALFPASHGLLLDYAPDGRARPLITWGRPAAAFAVTLPLANEQERLGILQIHGAGQAPPWLLSALAEHAAAGLAALRRQERLQDRAMRDALTGLFNRRFLEDNMAAQENHARRRGTAIGVLILDIDHFKRFNDSHGHDAGDAILRGVGALLRRAVREGDLPCRLGGEEFVVILPGADLDGTYQRAEALRAAIAGWRPEHDGQRLEPVTVSIGVAAFPRHGRDWKTVLKAADQALYAAKRGGRNQVRRACLEAHAG